MKELSADIIQFLQKQEFVLVATLDKEGYIHCSAKGVGLVQKEGKVYLIDLYKGSTFANLESNPLITITAIEEHSFKGYTLKGRAKIVSCDKMDSHILKKWEDKVVQRISKRVVRSVQADRQSQHHPESRFPSPQYIIEMQVERIVDLAPAPLIK